MIFIFLSWATALILIVLAALVNLKGGLPLALRLPRSKVLGVTLGLPVLVWCAWHGCIMLEGPLEKFHPIVWCLVPAITVLSYFFLDYLGARTLGGFLILSANELIRGAFGENIAMRPIFSLICLIIGICGIFMVGTPWRFRDILEATEKKSIFRKGFTAALIIFALVLGGLSFT